METKQEKILKINRDSSISNEEKMKQIREIMTVDTSQHLNIKEKCVHYKKLCSNFHFVCCDEYFDCVRCHNENDKCKEKIIIDSITCDNCNNSQFPTEKCNTCFTKFSRSHCNVCNIWSEKNIFHCDGCKICRVGNRSQFFHCDDCNMCFKIETQQTHTCKLKTTIDSKCGYCLLNVFDSQNHIIVLKCGHTAHRNCLSDAKDYRCPLCRKSLQDMKNYWNIVNFNVLQHPLPEEIKKNVNIICYDCEKESTDVNWHFMGTRCSNVECGSYNTSTC